MLMPLMRSNDLPLKLGERLPRDYEKKASARHLRETLAACAPVKWVTDDRTPLSDFPDCGVSEGSFHHEKCNVRARALGRWGPPVGYLEMLP